MYGILNKSVKYLVLTFYNIFNQMCRVIIFDKKLNKVYVTGGTEISKGFQTEGICFFNF